MFLSLRPRWRGIVGALCDMLDKRCPAWGGRRRKAARLVGRGRPVRPALMAHSESTPKLTSLLLGQGSASRGAIIGLLRGFKGSWGRLPKAPRPTSAKAAHGLALEAVRRVPSRVPKVQAGYQPCCPSASGPPGESSLGPSPLASTSLSITT